MSFLDLPEHDVADIVDGRGTVVRRTCQRCGRTAPTAIALVHPADRKRIIGDTRIPVGAHIVESRFVERGHIYVSTSPATTFDPPYCPADVPAPARPEPMTDTARQAWAQWRAADRIAAQVMRPDIGRLFIGGMS